MAGPQYVYVSTYWRTSWICPNFGNFCLFFVLLSIFLIVLLSYLAVLLKLKLQTFICKLLQLARAVPGARLLAELILHVKLWKKLPSCLAVLFSVHEPIWVVWIQSWICRKLVWKALPLWSSPAPCPLFSSSRAPLTHLPRRFSCCLPGLRLCRCPWLFSFRSSDGILSPSFSSASLGLSYVSSVLLLDLSSHSSVVICRFRLV